MSAFCVAVARVRFSSARPVLLLLCYVEALVEYYALAPYVVCSRAALPYLIPLYCLVREYAGRLAGESGG